MMSWENLQTELDSLLQTSNSLTEVLEQLYAQQKQVGVVDPDILRDIHASIPIFQHTHSHHFRLQLNPHRAKRGISLLENPNPVHIIPYKDGTPCFCCLENIRVQWPLERGFCVDVDEQALVFLPNIAPVFLNHFTVITPQHLPQRTDISLILKIAEKIPGYWVVQNGSQAGATNPWHFHLQAFKDTVPLSEYPVWHTWVLTPHIRLNKLDHPASIYRLDLPKNAPSAEIASHIVQEFEALDKNNRVNILALAEEKTIRLYIGLRNTTCIARYYKTGQPGYAEMSGVISTTVYDSFLEWKEQGWERFCVLMTDIRVPDALEKAFESLAESISKPLR
jgi:hypothetical protein